LGSIFFLFRHLKADWIEESGTNSLAALEEWYSIKTTEEVIGYGKIVV
jgi:hypothetical protein